MGMMLCIVILQETRSRRSTALGAALHERRTSLGLSLRDVAGDVVGISASTLCRVECGERQLSHVTVLIALAERLDMPKEELIDLAGGLLDEGVDELLGADLHLAVRGGRLVGPARAALRQVHLAELVRGTAGSSVESVAEDLGLDFRVTAAGDPGFDDELVYRIPRDERPAMQMMWRAHAAGHVMLARDAQTPPHCDFRAQQDQAEREATAIGQRLLVPSAALHGAHRRLGAPEPRDADELAGMVKGLAESLRAPVSWIVVRLADEGLVGAAS
jgi:transcriptional regulator with XRE-family HTH domain